MFSTNLVYPSFIDQHKPLYTNMVFGYRVLQKYIHNDPKERCTAREHLRGKTEISLLKTFVDLKSNSALLYNKVHNFF